MTLRQLTLEILSGKVYIRPILEITRRSWMQEIHMVMGSTGFTMRVKRNSIMSDAIWTVTREDGW